MKYSFIIIIACGLIAGCDKSSGTDAANVAMVEKYIQAVESKDYETMASLLDDNYLGLGPSIYDSIGKTAALENWQENIADLYEKIEYQRSQVAPVTITTGDNQGAWVANWAQLQITYKDDRGSVIIWANTNYKVENDKIVKSYTFYNEADVLRQLGYVFINPNEL
jgi:hypothetical protein